MNFNRLHSRVLVLAFPTALLGGDLTSSAAREVTFEKRLAAARAIETVYWKHRIWPKENPGSRPPVESLLSDGLIRAKVENYLDQSRALQELEHTAVTTRQLQGEIDRMIANSRDPRLLQELFDALGNDPLLVAETLARPTLVDRLVRSLYESDVPLHDSLRREIGSPLASCESFECVKTLGGQYRESTYTRGGDEAEDPTRSSSSMLGSLATSLGGSADHLPVHRWGALETAPDAYHVEAVLKTVSWPRLSFDEWWSARRKAIRAPFKASTGTFTLAAPNATNCVNDSWRSMVLEVAEARTKHVTVWTGSEMIVWGGTTANSALFLASGGRYNPATDTWTLTAMAGAPAARRSASAVWTGTQMIVWGGGTGSSFNSGGRYDPSTDSWLPTSTASGVPTARVEHTAVWTGNEMIVWGGELFGSGGRYNPTTDSWTATSVGSNVPAPRSRHTAVWTGQEMIVWGGQVCTDGCSATATGGRYNPLTNSWLPTSLTAATPSARDSHVSVWTGNEMIVWGGAASAGNVATGARYDPATNTWAAISAGPDAPSPRSGHSAVWTGSDMIVWGGQHGLTYPNTGARYSPSSNSWIATSTSGAPFGRGRQSAVWTGEEMIVWGGDYDLGGVTKTGGRYSPANDHWAPTATGAYVPEARQAFDAVWTGTELIIWGGLNGAAVRGGARYDPATDSWTATSLDGAPSARYSHTAIWTGTEVIVWGGTNNNAWLNSGGRYSPSTDGWRATSTGAGVPSPRGEYGVVWSGTEMILWGGYTGIGGAGYQATGGRYNPGSDSWQATSLGAGVPSARRGPSAVWTGTEMIVWGGYAGFAHLTTGGRYFPAGDSWLPTSTGPDVPVGRNAHSAVWTGTHMVIWGGDVFSSPTDLNSGARYLPDTDTWSPTSLVDAPAPRWNHSTVWTGAEMIIWGGYASQTGYKNSGGRYDPASNTWLPTSMNGAPPPLGDNVGAWTGSDLIVWGGGSAMGGLYCACPSGLLVFRDSDGDGYGDGAASKPSCDGATPAGYVTNAADCDDADMSIHDVASEVTGVRIVQTGADTSIEWDLLAGATSYQVVRGALDELPVGAGSGDETCLTGAQPSPPVSDPDPVDPGTGRWYLIRATNSCGPGTYGFERRAAFPDVSRETTTCP